MTEVIAVSTTLERPLAPVPTTRAIAQPTRAPGRAAVIGERLRDLLRLGARDWGTSPAVIAIMVVVPFVVVASGLATAALGRDAYQWFVDEDRFAETTQVIAFAAAAVFGVLTATRLRAGGERTLAAVFFVIGLGLVWVVGEEISWGQRIFGWATPETLLAVNRQAESNVHNILAVEITLRWVQFCVGAWGALLPFLLLRRPAQFRKWPIDLGRFVPHLVLVPYFACTFLWRAYRNVAPTPSSHRFFFAEWGEVIELNLALGFMLFMLYQWIQARRAAGHSEAHLGATILPWRGNEKPF
jgi:hypothetical protein